MINRAAWIPLVLIVTVAMATAVASSYPYVQAKIAPMMVGGIIILLSIVQLVKELRGGRARGRPQAILQPSLRAHLVEGLWMLGFLLAISVFGFLAGIAAYTTSYAMAKKARWEAALGLGLAMAVLCYGLLTYLMETELYPGIILRSLTSS
jgi:hypothetical protein